MSMEGNEMTSRHKQLLRCFAHLPQQILSLHQIDNATEFVLHSLCHEGGFNLSKAAYFIDNPDFDCLKGVAGFNKDEEVHTCDDILANEDYFTRHMDSCQFNKRVRRITAPSVKKIDDSIEKAVSRLAALLEIEDPSYYTLTIKHNNFGLVIYEQKTAEDHKMQEELLTGLALLGFCPIN